MLPSRNTDWRSATRSPTRRCSNCRPTLTNARRASTSGRCAGDAAAEHRQRLQSVVQQITQSEEAIRKKLDAVQRESIRLDELLAEKRSTYFTFYGYLPLPGKKWLELPVLDAFNSPRKIDNLWSAGLDQPSGSFGRVRRFDRCVTCHQGIQKPLDDAPAQPMFAPETTLDLAVDLPGNLGATGLPAAEPALAEPALVEPALSPKPWHPHNSTNSCVICSGSNWLARACCRPMRRL